MKVVTREEAIRLIREEHFRTFEDDATEAIEALVDIYTNGHVYTNGEPIKPLVKMSDSDIERDLNGMLGYANNDGVADADFPRYVVKG